MSDDFAALLDHLGLDSAHLVDAESVIQTIDNLFKFNFTDYYSQIQPPTQVLAGKWDIAFPLDQVWLLHQGIPNSRFHEFTASGHMPFLTQHDLFNHLFDEFISNTDTKGC